MNIIVLILLYFHTALFIKTQLVTQSYYILTPNTVAHKLH